MVETRTALENDIPALKKLWEVAFGDPKEFIDLFFQCKFKKERTHVLLDHGVVAAMTTAVPVQYRGSDGNVLQGVMLYAVATDPLYRGKGYSTLLMDVVNQTYFNEETKVSVLVPADGPLIGFYQKRGYEEGFQIREGIVPGHRWASGGNRTIIMDLEPAAPLAYNCIRNHMLAGTPSILYMEEDLAFQKELAALSGGDLFTLACRDNGETGCAIVERVNERRLFVKELLVKDGCVSDALAAILIRMPCDEVVVRLPVHCKEMPLLQTRLFGMIKGTHSNAYPKNGYLGIAFD